MEIAFLARERTVAGPRFNRWLVPPAALAIHLCIGMAYGFSVFWLPLSRALGIKEPIACPKELTLFGELFTTRCDWRISTMGWLFTLFFVFLGSSAALFGGWLEHAGPRKAGVVSALCWCGGLLISALGVRLHQMWLLWLGSGVIGGIGLGLGYISPVSTLIKWFPDRRGMATGLAIMGFGGGAMIGAPLADRLMKHFATATSVGVWETFVALAILYFLFMMGGALGYRVPAANFRPEGWTPSPARDGDALMTGNHVHVSRVLRIPQFWLLWGVLCLNVSAGIGILGMASPLLQEVFAGRLIGVAGAFNDLSPDQKRAIAAIAAGFTGLLSLFNIAGRFAWASLSDRIGRKVTYAIFFAAGIAAYSSVPSLSGRALGLFVAVFCLILSMYGGGFATIPAYLADLFGTQMVGAIHGRLLTAWATAGIVGPVVVNYVREYQIDHGAPRAAAYGITMYVLAGMLALGLVCNLLVRPLPERWFMTPGELERERQLARERAAASALPAGGEAATDDNATSPFVLALAWLAVGLPLGWGIFITLGKAVLLFQ
jgi:MFS family permease